MNTEQPLVQTRLAMAAIFPEQLLILYEKLKQKPMTNVCDLVTRIPSESIIIYSLYLCDVTTDTCSLEFAAKL